MTKRHHKLSRAETVALNFLHSKLSEAFGGGTSVTVESIASSPSRKKRIRTGDSHPSIQVREKSVVINGIMVFHLERRRDDDGSEFHWLIVGISFPYKGETLHFHASPSVVATRDIRAYIREGEGSSLSSEDIFRRFLEKNHVIGGYRDEWERLIESIVAERATARPARRRKSLGRI